MDAGQTPRVRGRVKWFDVARGYGFITAEDGEDVFVHHSAVASADVPGLTPGRELEFEFAANRRGRQAVNVVPLG